MNETLLAWFSDLCDFYEFSGDEYRIKIKVALDAIRELVDYEYVKQLDQRFQRALDGASWQEIQTEMKIRKEQRENQRNK
jgi:hypothetical protein